ncbi:hypothetical protein FA15DRAFT_654052 [Coprinopsis marcescibilis]|uniref:Uncharacterized protein n=1 Tax=Coprinopsis marcescibilis TaxID=230819 RepID=A0A5C3L1M9_COPMA|nr:hypothetical protein FA15DRAFT_654052 [Coprinopsis marcescibilis]
MAYYVNDYAAVGSNRRITPKWSILLCTDQRVLMKAGILLHSEPTDLAESIWMMNERNDLRRKTELRAPSKAAASRTPQSVHTYIGGCGHDGGVMLWRQVHSLNKGMFELSTRYRHTEKIPISPEVSETPL